MVSKVTKLFTTGAMKVLHCTQLAAQFQDADGEKHWLPFSQIREPSEEEIIQAIDSELELEVTIPEWMAKEKGFI